jgi:hypothetical protein
MMAPEKMAKAMRHWSHHRITDAAEFSRFSGSCVTLCADGASGCWSAIRIIDPCSIFAISPAFVSVFRVVLFLFSVGHRTDGVV